MKTHQIYYAINPEQARLAFRAIRTCISPSFRDELKKRGLMEAIYSDVLSTVFFESVEGANSFTIATMACHKSLVAHGFKRDGGTGFYFGETSLIDIFSPKDKENETTEKFIRVPAAKSKEVKGFFCAGCGKSFLPSHHRQIYCSPACKVIGRNKKRRSHYRQNSTLLISYCKQCGHSFIRSSNNQLFCSTKCKDNWYYHNIRKEKKQWNTKNAQ